MPDRIRWHAWSPDAFADASRGGRPVLLSLVTAWSEACRAMDRSTFAHPDVVALVGERFVPVRVDADARPDVNERYNLGGWPTTAFLTSEGGMLGGGTYYDAGELSRLLQQVADAHRSPRRTAAPQTLPARPATDARIPAGGHLPGWAAHHFRARLLDEFDESRRLLGRGPRLAHPHALLFAWMLIRTTDDRELHRMAGAALDGTEALWDREDGGYSRCAEAESTAACAERTLDDNALMLHVLAEAGAAGHPAAAERALRLTAWLRLRMWDRHRGFANACGADAVDPSVYIDRNAMVIGALLQTAAVFDVRDVRDFALEALEAVLVPAYRPGEGMAHAADVPGMAGDVPRLLGDQIYAASALIWAHAATDRLPYSMLAAELLGFARRRMWQEEPEGFRDRAAADDPIVPFDLNCHAACVMGRFAYVTAERSWSESAGRLLEARAADFLRRGLFGAPLACAALELDGVLPAGLHLRRAEWQLP